MSEPPKKTTDKASPALALRSTSTKEAFLPQLLPAMTDAARAIDSPATIPDVQTLDLFISSTSLLRRFSHQLFVKHVEDLFVAHLLVLAAFQHIVKPESLQLARGPVRKEHVPPKLG
ncbi:MAG: hypothetical protein WCJ18_10100 [Planctomycetota bacterium]